MSDPQPPTPVLRMGGQDGTSADSHLRIGVRCFFGRGLIFLKYISDAFEEQRARLEAERSQGADPEDPDEYRAVHIFWVPREARWSQLKAQAKQPTIGRFVDDAMEAVERDNPSRKQVLPRDYAWPTLGKQRLCAAETRSNAVHR